MADALDGDYSCSQAVLIGTWDYTDLAPVPAARHSLNRMHTLLTGPLCGWPTERVSVVANQPTLGTLPHLLVEKFQPVSDVALFYYVGHGQYDHDDRLCLALGDSSVEPDLRTTTSLVFDAVRHAFKMSDARTKIAILDCCFAGLAAGSEGRLAARTAGLPRSPGSYLMMASGEFSTAWFQSAAEEPFPQTYFTKCLADTVEDGIPGQPAGLALGPIYDRVADALVHDRKPEPACHTSDQAAHFVFARNTAAARPADAGPHADRSRRDLAHDPPARASDRASKRRSPVPRRRLVSAIAAIVTVAAAALALGEFVVGNGHGSDNTPPPASTASRFKDSSPAAILKALPTSLQHRGGCRPTEDVGGKSLLRCRIEAGDLTFGYLFRNQTIDNGFVARIEADPSTSADSLRKNHRSKVTQDDIRTVAIDDSQPDSVRIEYLDTRSGLSLSLWGLASWNAAQTFLDRAGLQ
ncbi:caspase family protein [Streptomyces olivoreticuli]